MGVGPAVAGRNGLELAAPLMEEKRMRREFLTVTLVMLLFGVACTVRSGDPDTLATEQDSFQIGDSTILKVKHQAGDLEIIGEPGIEEVFVEIEKRGRVFPEDDLQEYLKAYEIKHEAVEGALVVETSVEALPFGRQGWINLKLRVPERLKVEVDAGNCEVKIVGAANGVNVDSGMGEASFTRIRGGLEVKNGGGEVQVEEVEGNCELSLRWGSLTVRNLRGDLFSDGPEHGGATIEQVTGNVVLEDLQGKIKIDQVGGNLTVRDHQWGKIEHTNVSGTVTLPERWAR